MIVLKNKNVLIKKILPVCLLALSLNSMGQVTIEPMIQKTSTMSDPSLGRITLTDLSDNVLDAGNLQMNKLVKLKIPVTNNGQLSLPVGSCKVKIGLGSKIVLDPNFSLANTVNYFKWTVVQAGGQSQLIGELVQPLPPSTTNIPVFFRTLGTREGNSTITANFLVSNHYTQNTLSDIDPTNNTSFLPYTIRQSTKGPFNTVDVTKAGCTINVAFATEQEVNVNRYEIEMSKDNVSYVKIGETAARNLLYYNNNFQITAEMKASMIYVRVKLVMNDGRFKYSESRTVSGACEEAWVLTLYPNPVLDVKQVTITAKEGVFDGKYKISVLDANGKLMQVKNIEMQYVSQFKYDLSLLGAGQYMMRIQSEDGSKTTVLKFEKL